MTEKTEKWEKLPPEEAITSKEWDRILENLKQLWNVLLQYFSSPSLSRAGRPAHGKEEPAMMGGNREVMK